MDEGFRLAGSYVEVNLRDNTQRDLDKLKANIEKLSGDVTIGANTKKAQSELDKFRAAVEKTKANVELGAKANQSSAKKAGEDVIKTASAKSGKVNVEAKADQASAAKAGEEVAKTASEKSSKVKVKGEADLPSAAKAGEEVSRTAAAAAEQDASGNGRMSHVGRIMMLAVAAGITAGGPLIAGAGVLAVGVGVTAIAAAVEKEQPRIQDAWNRFADTGMKSLTDGFSKLTPVIERQLNSWTQAVHGMEPQFEKLATASTPFINQISHSLQDATNISLKGFVDMMQRSGPIVTALGNGIRTIAQDISTMFHNLNFSPQASQGLERLLTAVGGLLPMLTDILNATMPLGNAFLGMIIKAEKMVSTVAQELTPVLRILGTVLDNLSTPITGIGLGLLTAAGFAKLFGTSLKSIAALTKGLALAKTAEDVAKVGSSFAGSSKGISGFVAKLSGIAAPAVVGQTAAGAMGVSAAALGTAAGVGAVGLASLGAAFVLLTPHMSNFSYSSSQATSDAEKMAQGWAAGGQAAKNAFADYDSHAQKVQQLTGQINFATKASEGQAAADDGLARKLGDLNSERDNERSAMDQANQKYQEILNKMDPVTRAQTVYNNTVARYGQQAPLAKDAAEKYATAMEQSAQKTYDDARAAETDSQKIQDLINAKLGLIHVNLSAQGSLLGSLDAQDRYNAAVSKGGANSRRAKEELIRWEQSQQTYVANAMKQAKATDDASDAAGHYVSQTDRATHQTEAHDRAIMTLVNNSNGHLSPTLLQQVKELKNSGYASDVTSGKIKGLTEHVLKVPGKGTIHWYTNSAGTVVDVNKVKNSVNNVPKNPTITFHSNIEYIHSRIDAAARAMASFYQNEQHVASEAKGTAFGGVSNRASGGPISGPGTSTSDSIPAMLSDGEYVINASAVAHYGPGLMGALNAKKLAAGGPASGTAKPAAAVGSAVPIVQNNTVAGSIEPSKLGAATAAAAALTAATNKLGASQLGTGGAANSVTLMLAKLKVAQTQAIASDSASANSLNSKLTPAFGRNTMAAGIATNATHVLRQSQTPFQAAVNQSAARVNVDWTQIQNRIVTSANAVTNRQQQMQSHQAASWNAISNSVSASVTHQRGSLASLNSGVDQSQNNIVAFEHQAKASFNAIYNDAATPIRSTLRGPINKGIIGAWNSLDKQFALGKHVGAVPMFAEGGRVDGPGNGTSDSIDAKLSKGEFVVREKIARNAMPFLHALNAGQAEAVQATGGPKANVPGYAEGGVVANTGSAQKAALDRGNAAINRMAGKRYIWGGASPEGADCSGLVAIITNALRGESNIFHRIGVANSQPWPGFVRGLSSAFGTGFNSHHTASTLAGRNSEARDFNIPILVGGAAAGAKSSQFTGTASLPFVGGRFIGGDGGGGIDFQAEIDKAFAGTKKMIGQVRSRFPGNIAAIDSTGVAEQGMSKVQAKAMTALMESPAAGIGGGVQRWSPLVLRALAMLHQPSSLLPAVLRRMQQESGGDPNIVNTWDSNAKAGHPSTGLMQTIQGTFDRYAGPFAGKPMTDPMANIYAALNYSLNEYGSVAAAMNKAGGYDNGGPLPPGITQVHNNSGKVENVQTSQQRDELRDELRGLRADLKQMQTRPQVTVQPTMGGTIEEISNRVASIIERRFASQF